MSYRACGSDGNEYHGWGSTSFFLAFLGVNGERAPEFEVKGARDSIIHDVREAGSGRYQLLYACLRNAGGIRPRGAVSWWKASLDRYSASNYS